MKRTNDAEKPPKPVLISPQTDKPVVARRHVFFVPGYDPNAPRRYREFYRSEGKVQAEISGYALDVSEGPKGEFYAWNVAARMEGRDVRARIELLTWADLVRASMSKSVLRAIWLYLVTAWVYVSSGALFRLLRLRPQPMLAALYPGVIVALQLTASALAGWLIARGVAILLPSILAALVGVIVFVALMTAFRRRDDKFFAYYLINDFAYTARDRGAYPRGLSTRIDAFAERINAVVREGEVDEVLVVGHSSGAQVAVSALARALAKLGEDKPRPNISLLTLGQSIPMMSFLPNARALRGDLHALSREMRLAWIDVSAPGDGGCFALADPVHVSGVAPDEAEKFWPKVISAAYSSSLEPATLKATRFNFFRRHIQYMAAFDHPQGYDYFAITAGPYTLGGRFDWRGATATRIETPLSGYRDI